MPQFSPGEVKTAIAPIKAGPAGMSCEAELFLGPDDLTKIATSGGVPFVSAGKDQSVNVSLPVTMPSEEGSYHGYIDVFADGMRFLAYKATEDVVVATVGPPLASCVYDGTQFSSENELVAHMNASHPGKPYIVWAYLPEEDVVLIPSGMYSIKAKVYAPSTGVKETWRYSFKAYKGAPAWFIIVGDGAPAGFYIGETEAYNCTHRMGVWSCPAKGEYAVNSSCYFHSMVGGDWYDKPIWQSKDIGLRVNFI